MGTYLVVANHTLGGTALVSTVQEHVMEGDAIRVVVPAGDLSDEPTDDAALEAEDSPGAARRLLQEAIDRFRAAGVEAEGSVGPADPVEAIRDAMRTGRYDGIIIATHPAGASKWFHMDLPHRIEREFQLPVEWIESRGDSPDEEASVNIDLPSSALRNEGEEPLD
jgi:hypothetical protein